MSKFTLSAKIISGFATVIVLMAVVVGGYQYAITKTSSGFRSLLSSDLTIKEHAKAIESLAAKADREVMAFMLKKDPGAVEAAQQLINTLLSNTAEIQRMAGQQADSSQIASEAGAISGQAKTYLGKLDELLATQRTIGLNATSGLQAKFRDAAHAIEGALEEFDVDALYIELLQMRQAEKEYNRVKSEGNAQLLTDEIGKMTALLEASACVPEVKKAMQQAVAAYQAAFTKFQTAEQNLQQAMEYHNMRGEAGKIETAIATIRLPGAAALMSRIRKDEKDFLLRGDKALIDQLHTNVEQLNTMLTGATILPEYKDKLAKDLGDYRQAFDAVTVEMGKAAEIQNLLLQTAQQMEKAVDTISGESESRAGKGTEAIVGQTSLLANTAISVGIATMIAGLIFGVMLSRGISRPIDATVNELNGAAGMVAAVSSQIKSSSQALAEGAAGQAAALEETSASIEEMTSVTRHTSDNAGEADSLMKSVLSIVRTADQSMAEMQRAMEEIATASGETSKIIKTINEIAFQTNLLALNAAVEAARAGAAGAGFAVVAEEVRNLAMRSAEAADNTAKLIEGTVGKVNHGKTVVSSTNEAFREVCTASEKVGGLIAEIASAAKEQAQGLGQINQAITQMDSVTQQNTAHAAESASSAQDLSSQAERLLTVVNGLRVMVEGGKAAAGWENAPAKQRALAQQGKTPLLLTAKTKG